MAERKGDKELDRVWMRYEKAVRAARTRRDAECWRVEKPIIKKVDELDKVLDKAIKDIERECNKRMCEVEKRIRLRQNLLQRDEDKRTAKLWKAFDKELDKLTSEREKNLKALEKLHGGNAVDRAHERHVKRTWGGGARRSKGGGR